MISTSQSKLQIETNSVIRFQIKLEYLEVAANWYTLFTAFNTLIILKKSMTKRPVFLQLTKIHLPVAAIVSLLHRVSGILLSLLIPVFIFLFGLSIRDHQGYLQVLDLLNSIPGKLVVVFLVWVLAHHFFAGLRFLLIDLDVGLLKTTAARSAWLVHIGAVSVAALTLGFIL